MRDRLTYIIHTHNRPACCARLVRSIVEQFPDEETRPLIHVSDDGEAAYRLSDHEPEVLDLIDYLHELPEDVGLSAARNLLVSHARTELVFLSDDDHVLVPETKIPLLIEKYDRHGFDVLATKSNQTEPPRLMRSDGRVLTISRGARSWSEHIGTCDMVGNCLLASREMLARVKWDEDLKLEEHWEFFWRAKVLGLRVGVATDHMIEHRHEDPPGYQRFRPEFVDMAKEKHGIQTVRWDLKEKPKHRRGKK